MAIVVAPVPALADNLARALVNAYSQNPDLAAARAGLRATDENIAIAKAGQRPVIAAEASVEHSETNGEKDRETDISLSFSQSIFDGFKTKNNVLAAQASILAGRQTLLSTEMDIFITVVQAYVDVLLYQQITSIRKQNLDFLVEQLNASQARLDAGEGTRTDVAQSEASLAAARAQVVAAEADAKASRAIYKQVVGQNARGLSVPAVPTKYLPSSLNRALGIGLSEHPVLASARHNIEASEYNVAVQKSELLPGVSLSGSVSRDQDNDTTGTIAARLSIPIFSGGANHARVRQSVEQLGQARLQRDSVLRSVEQVIIDAWVGFQSAQASIEANDAQVKASGQALNGVVEEQSVGQRTTLDVLNAQANVLSAREALVQSQRNLIVAGYNILYSTGQLTAERLGLNVDPYEPEEHFNAVKDKWFGLRTVTQ